MTPCLRWTGLHRKHDGRPVEHKRYVYRIAYEAKYGALPAGMVLHHQCGNVWCVNPDHLQPITQGEHNRLHERGGDWGQARKTYCPAGHPYNEENTYRWRGERQCRICRRETMRKLRAAKAARERGEVL